MQQQQDPIARAAPSRLNPPPFLCASATDGAGGCWVRVSGELDVVSAPVLRTVLRDAQAAAPLVVVDLEALTFIDSSGLHVLEDCSLAALMTGERLVLVRVPAHAVRALEACGLGPALEVFDLDVPRMGCRR